jgi:hypothetical protein
MKKEFTSKLKNVAKVTGKIAIKTTNLVTSIAAGATVASLISGKDVCHNPELSTIVGVSSGVAAGTVTHAVLNEIETVVASKINNKNN